MHIASMPRAISALAVIGTLTATASAQELKITSVSATRLGKQNLCEALGGKGVPPTITIRHSRTAGRISLSMIDHLNTGNTVNHGSTSVQANPSGITKVTYNFLPPCNRRTAEGRKSAYHVTVSSGGSSKTIVWGRYP